MLNFAANYPMPGLLDRRVAAKGESQHILRFQTVWVEVDTTMTKLDRKRGRKDEELSSPARQIR